MKILIKLIVCAVAACASITALAQTPVLTNKATELRASPEDTARVVQPLADKTEVKVLVRQGAWQQVRVGNNTGWVRMMHLRGGSSVVAEQQSASGGYLAAFTRLLTGGSDRPRTSQRAQSATVGVRGFSKEDVAAAELNPAELEKLKRFTPSDADGRRLANQGRLAFRSVAYLAQDAVEAANQQGARK
jgi:hypothetical protein